MTRLHIVAGYVAAIVLFVPSVMLSACSPGRSWSRPSSGTSNFLFSDEAAVLQALAALHDVQARTGVLPVPAGGPSHGTASATGRTSRFLPTPTVPMSPLAAGE